MGRFGARTPTAGHIWPDSSPAVCSSRPRFPKDRASIHKTIGTKTAGIRAAGTRPLPAPLPRPVFKLILLLERRRIEGGYEYGTIANR